MILTTAKTTTCFWSVLQASADMEEIFLFIDNLNKRLARGIKDLDDVRSSMAALSEIRESEIRFVLVHYREEIDWVALTTLIQNTMFLPPFWWHLT